MFLSKQNKIKWRLLIFAALVVMGLVFAGIYWFDKPLFVLLRNFDCVLFRMFEHIFDAGIWLIAFGLITILIYARKVVKAGNLKFKDWFNVKNFMLNMQSTNAFLIFCSVLSASIVGKILKVCIGRFRPVFYEALGITGFNPFSWDWAFNSMPSGHAFATFAGLVTIGMLKPKYKWLTWTGAILVGLSRVAVGAHWVTDVLLGAFIGMVAADLVLATMRR